MPLPLILPALNLKHNHDWRYLNYFRETDKEEGVISTVGKPNEIVKAQQQQRKQ